MPNCITHFLYTKEVFKHVESGLQEKVHDKAFTWGAQGPDFLFCHRYFPWQKGKNYRELGTKLHKHSVTETLDALRRYLINNNDAITRSYIYGFICHYALDSTAHPYIISLSKELLEGEEVETETTLHAIIESSIDTIMLRSITGKLPTEIKLKKLFPKDEETQNVIAKIYSYLFKELWNLDIREEKILEATNDANFVFMMLTDKTTIKKKLVDLIEKGKPSAMSSHITPIIENEEIDFANINKSDWIANGETHNESFFELYDKAVEKGTLIINGFETIDFLEATQNTPFG